MIWKKITINTNVEAADIVASVLFDNNIVGAEIEDNQNLTEDELKKMYVDIPKLNIDDGKSKVSFYVSIGEKSDKDFSKVDNNLVDNSYMRSNDNIFTKEEFEAIFEKIKEDLEDYKSFMDMGSLDIEEEDLDDEIFLNKWKENFKSLEIDDINILPNWEKAKEGKINIFIEPGNAFGTGQHATTKLCVRAIDEIVKSNRVNNFLDIGTGSGILSIIANKLGVKNIVAIDIDENCEFNILDNLKLNNINSFYKIDDNFNLDILNKYDLVYGFGNIITDDELKKKIKLAKYDIVVANILAPVLISLIEVGKISDYINDNGYLILSGIIKEKEEDVISCFKRAKCFKNINSYYEDDWVLISCEKE